MERLPDVSLSQADAAAAFGRSLLDRIKRDDMIAVSCHFPEPGFGRITTFEGKRYWQAL